MLISTPDMPDTIDAINYYPIDTDGNSLDPILVDLNPDGSANLSRLPESMRQDLLFFGAPDQVHRGRVSAKDGRAFLQALLDSAGAYRRFGLTTE